jgi:hypothetical protein
MDRASQTGVIYTDFSKAFDMLDHDPAEQAWERSETDGKE